MTLCRISLRLKQGCTRMVSDIVSDITTAEVGLHEDGE